MAKKKADDPPPAGVPAWTATLADLFTVLMCFFVLMFAMSTMDEIKFQSIAAALAGNPVSILSSTGASDGIMDFIGSGIMDMPDVKEVKGEAREEYEKVQEELSRFASDFRTYLAENNIAEESVSIEQGEQSIRIRLIDGIMFDLGQAILKPEALEILDLIAHELNNYPDNDINIEGHTDNLPIRTAMYPSNLYLSSARAIAVAEYFINMKGISPFRVVPVGFGENRPLVDNDTPENRAKNRRVEINIVSRHYSMGQ